MGHGGRAKRGGGGPFPRRKGEKATTPQKRKLTAQGSKSTPKKATYASLGLNVFFFTPDTVEYEC